MEGSTAGKLTKVKWLVTDKVFIGGFTLKEDEQVGTVVDKTVVLGEYSVAPGSDGTTATLNPGSSLLYSAEGTPQQIIAVYPASISNYIVNNVTTEQINAAQNNSTLRNYALKITLPAIQTYAGSDISKIAPMMAVTETGGNLEFKNITALLAITVPSSEMSSVQKITITSGKKLNGEVSLMSDGVSLKLGDNVYDAEKTLTLDCTNEGANTTIPSGGSKTFYVSIPPQTYDYLQFDVTDGTNTKTMKTKAGTSISVARNTIYPIAFAKNYDPNLLKGVFSVSAGVDGIAGTADDKKVKFTKANLWWDGSAYQFEADQTNYPTAWNTSHVGLFFWSNYTDYTRTDEHASDYKPYYSSFGASSKTNDVFWCGEAHPLEVAGTQGLYVLSSKEWNYLLNIPNNNNPVGRTQNNRFAKARVNGKVGLLIFPDGYNGTTTLTGITGMCTVNEDWDDAYPGESESIDPATWTDMESAGVVFLPAAGYRGTPNGETIRNENYCYYWSSTPNSDYTDRANGLYGNGNQFTCPGTILRNYGSSIRLVKTVE